jgi:hypothetical protein
MKLVWLDLDSIYKIYKRNMKIEKRKEGNKIKMKLDPGETIRPTKRNQPAAHPNLPRTGTLSPSFSH